MGNQIARTKRPVTVDSLYVELGSLGVRAGDLVLVHTSLRSLGWVNGGPVAVVQALLRAVGDNGTIVMPSHSSDLTNPENWMAPPVPKEWHDTIRNTMPAYNPLITPTSHMGQVAELFRTWPGVVRSDHPSASFAALGPLATQITSHHSLSDPLGSTSPLGTLYQLGAKVLLIGVDFDKCTALHLAEQMTWPDRERVVEGAPILIDGQRQWISFEVPQLMDSDAFLSIQASVLGSGIATAGPLGEGRGILAEMKHLVDYAVKLWSSIPKTAVVSLPA